MKRNFALSFGSFAAVVNEDSVSVISGPTKACHELCLSPDGSQLFIASADFSVSCFSVSKTGKVSFNCTLNDHKGAVFTCTATEEYLFTGGSGGLGVIYSIKTGNVERLSELKLHEGSIICSQLLDGNNIQTGSTDGHVSTWKLPEMTPLSKSEAVKLPAGQVLSFSGRFITRLSGAVDEIQFGHSKGIVSVKTASNEGSVQTQSYDGEEHTWQWKEGKLCRISSKQTTNPNPNTNDRPSATWKDFKVVADDKHSIQLFLKEELVKTHWCHHSARIDALIWLPDLEVIVSAGVDGCLFAWSPENKNGPICELKSAHFGPISGLSAISGAGKGQFVSVGQDCSIRLWQFE